MITMGRFAEQIAGTEHAAALIPDLRAGASMMNLHQWGFHMSASP